MKKFLLKEGRSEGTICLWDGEITLPSNIFETMNWQTSEEVNEDGFYSKWKTHIGR
jgi:hypothetical protein